jgi:hypothetical protein
MKLRIVQKPSLTGTYCVNWYTVQVRRFGFWIDCRDDLWMMFKYSSSMLLQSYDTNIDRVEEFIDHVMRGEDMFAKSKDRIIKEYEI